MTDGFVETIQPWTMVAAETCDSTLCRPIAGCWVSDLCQRSNQIRFRGPRPSPNCARKPVPLVNGRSPMTKRRGQYTTLRREKSIVLADFSKNWAHLRNSPISCPREDFGNNMNNLNTTTERGARTNRSAHRLSFACDSNRQRRQ